MKKLFFLTLLFISSTIFAQNQGKRWVLKVTDGTVPLNTHFNFVVNNTTGQSPEINFNILSYSNSTGWHPTIDWGDGTTTARTLDSIGYTIDHFYTLNGTYTNTVYITGDTSFVRQIYFNQNAAPATVTSINNLKNFPLLDQLKLNGISIASLNNIVYPSTVTHISVLSDPILTNFDPATALPSGLVYLQLSGSGGGGIGTGVFPYFHPTIALPPTINTLTLSSNNWDSTAVNNTLIYLDGQTFNAGAKTLTVKQYNTKSAPTGAGITALNSLIAKGWTVTHD